MQANPGGHWGGSRWWCGSRLGEKRSCHRIEGSGVPHLPAEAPGHLGPDCEASPNLLVRGDCRHRLWPSSLDLKGLQSRVGFGKHCDCSGKPDCGGIHLFHKPDVIGVGTVVLFHNLRLAGNRRLEPVRVGPSRFDRKLGEAQGLDGIGRVQETTRALAVFSAESASESTFGSRPMAAA